MWITETFAKEILSLPKIKMPSGENTSLGKVTKAYISSDGRVRREVVGYKNTPGGIKCGGAKFTHVERPIHKLIII